MQNATTYHLELPFKERLDYLIKVYGDFEPSEFKIALRKLEPRMGTSNNHKALHFYESGQVRKCFELLLNYYDKAYAKRRMIGWSGKIVRIIHRHDNLTATLKKIEKP
jgi:tRNA 2-selenouridine synthase